MLFDKDGFYMIASTKDDYDFAIDIMPISEGMSGTKENLYDPKEGLRRGNLFPKLYDPYMNYEPREIKVRTEREKCLLEIQRLDFAINDLNLYLDIYPNDREAYRLFSKYVEECKMKKENYKRIYGPLMLDEITDDYEWGTGVWPWEEGGM